MADYDPTTDPLIGQVFAGRYELTARLGAGRMAVVYASRDRVLKRAVAVKILKPEHARDAVARERLLREAKAAGRLHHPHVITLHDVGVSAGCVFIVMELLRGRSLAEAMESGLADFPALRAAALGAQIAAALEVVHGAGIVHRDLKPDNIFLVNRASGGDFIKLLDFSIAKLPERMVDGRLTRTGTVLGTLRYMAPEQAMGDPVRVQTDLYALGAILLEMLAGRPPFEAKNVIDLLTRVSTHGAPTLEALGVRSPERLTVLVARLLERESWHRPSSATEVRRELEAIVTAADPGPRPRPRGRAGRKLAGIADRTRKGPGPIDDGGVTAPGAIMSRRSGGARVDAAKEPGGRSKFRITQRHTARSVSVGLGAEEPAVAGPGRPETEGIGRQEPEVPSRPQPVDPGRGRRATLKQGSGAQPPAESGRK